MKNKFIKIIIGVILFTGVVLISPLVIGFGKTGKNTVVLNQDYSFLDKKQINDHLDHDFPFPATLTLQTTSRKFELQLSSISATLDKSKMVKSLLFRRLNQGLGNYIHAFFAPKNFDLEISYNSDSLDNYLNTVADQIDRPFIPSEVVIDAGAPQVKTGQLGSKTKVEELKKSIISSLHFYEVKSPIDIPIEIIGKLPDVDQQATALKTAKKLISKSLSLSYSRQTIILDDKSLVPWVAFDTGCRTDKIGEYVDSISSSIKKDPIDAVFRFENGKVTEFQSSQNGYSLDSEKLKSQLCPQLNQLISSTDIKLIIDLPLIYTEPKIKTADVNNLGIKDLLGRGTSSFRHSTDIRNYNVQKGSSIVNRILVAPNETFSFLKNLGDVSLDNGFKKAYVIKKGQTVLDVGGGICQVSTTLFRAMLNAGLDITDRKNHAYRVSYYEEDSRPGFDATVFIPSPDLKFVNDTGHYLLIQSTYDGKVKSLTYEIYGTSDGRSVDISNYRQWDAQPAPPAIYIDDPTLPPGKVVQDEHAIPGLKTSFEWKVTRDGQIIHQKTYSSVYVPWAAVFRRGPTI